MSDELEIEFEDAKKGVKLRLKGNPTVVKAAIEEYGYTDAIKEAASRTSGQANASTTTATATPVESTSETPDKPEAKTLTDYVIALIHNDWAINGRTSSELQAVASKHGIPVSMSTLSSILIGLVKSNRLRRDKRPGEGQWKYFVPASVAMQRR